MQSEKKAAMEPVKVRRVHEESRTGVQLRHRLLEVKREEILRVAGELFFKKGFIQTSVEEIAVRLGIGKPQIYACYPSKKALLAEVCNRTTMLAANVAAEAARAEGTPTDRVAHVVRELTRRVIEGRMNLAVLFREVKHLPQEAIDELAHNFHLFNRSFESLLREGIETGEFQIEHPAVVTHAVSGMATWMYSWFSPDGPLPAEQVVKEMVRLALLMVRATDSERPGRLPARGGDDRYTHQARVAKKYRAAPPR